MNESQPKEQPESTKLDRPNVERSSRLSKRKKVAILGTAAIVGVGGALGIHQLHEYLGDREREDNRAERLEIDKLRAENDSMFGEVESGHYLVRAGVEVLETPDEISANFFNGNKGNVSFTVSEDRELDIVNAVSVTHGEHDYIAFQLVSPHDLVHNPNDEFVPNKDVAEQIYYINLSAYEGKKLDDTKGLVEKRPLSPDLDQPSDSFTISDSGRFFVSAEPEKYLVGYASEFEAGAIDKYEEHFSN